LKAAKPHSASAHDASAFASIDEVEPMMHALTASLPTFMNTLIERGWSAHAAPGTEAEPLACELNRLIDFADVVEEARAFLSLSHPEQEPPPKRRATTLAQLGSAEAARRLSQQDDFELHHAASPTANVLQELQLYGYRPFEDEPDPRPLPEGNRVTGAISDIFDALIATFIDTRLEPDLDDLLWSAVNVFHRAASRIERELDGNEQAQRRSQKEQDGSEVKSVELERLIAEGQTLIERRDAFELMRDQAADHFERHTGSSWRPRAGSMVNHRNLTAAMIDSREFLAAKKRAETDVLIPAGPKIALSGGEGGDHRLIWAKLDQVHAKHPDMVLLHGGSPKGAEKIAARWADHRKVPQIAFKPDWTKHAKAAPFKRNDQMLSVLPIGVIIFPGTGIQDNLADKARQMGIPVYRFGSGGA
jgi:hypothetical protein